MNNFNLDSNYMTFEEFINKVRIDLNDSDFMVFDMPAPKNEKQYQEFLVECKYLSNGKY